MRRGTVARRQLDDDDDGPSLRLPFVSAAFTAAAERSANDQAELTESCCHHPVLHSQSKPGVKKLFASSPNGAGDRFHFPVESTKSHY